MIGRIDDKTYLSQTTDILQTLTGSDAVSTISTYDQEASFEKAFACIINGTPCPSVPMIEAKYDERDAVERMRAIFAQIVREPGKTYFIYDPKEDTIAVEAGDDIIVGNLKILDDRNETAKLLAEARKIANGYIIVSIPTADAKAAGYEYHPVLAHNAEHGLIIEYKGFAIDVRTMPGIADGATSAQRWMFLTNDLPNTVAMCAPVPASQTAAFNSGIRRSASQLARPTKRRGRGRGPRRPQDDTARTAATTYAASQTGRAAATEVRESNAFTQPNTVAIGTKAGEPATEAKTPPAAAPPPATVAAKSPAEQPVTKGLVETKERDTGKDIRGNESIMQIGGNRMENAEFSLRQMIGNMYAVYAIDLGVRLGLFKQLSVIEPVSIDELFARVGSSADANLKHAWMRAMQATGIIDVGQDNQVVFNPKWRIPLTDPTSATYIATLPTCYIALSQAYPGFIDIFKTGRTLPWQNLGKAVIEHISADSLRGANYFIENVVNKVDGLATKLRNGITVLDVGCSAGHMTIRLAKAFPNSRFIGIDPCEEAIALAKGHAIEQAEVHNVTYENMCATRIAPNTVDVVILNDVLHEMDVNLRAQALRMIHGSLRERGGMFISDPVAPPTPSGFLKENAKISAITLFFESPFGAKVHTRNELVGLLKEAGFGKMVEFESSELDFTAYVYLSE